MKNSLTSYLERETNKTGKGTNKRIMLVILIATENVVLLYFSMFKLLFKEFTGEIRLWIESIPIVWGRDNSVKEKIIL